MPPQSLLSTTHVALAALLLLGAGCSSDLAESEMQDTEPSDTDMDVETSLRLVEAQVDGLEPLANGFLYEGWAIIDDAPISFGKFNVDLSGTVTDSDGIAIPDSIFDAGRDLSEATAIVITVEPAGDTDIIPSATKILGGDLEGSAAALTTNHPGTGLASDFADSAGRFILATPTSEANDDETSGVWFLDLSTAPPMPGLDLPELDEGWAYEGWVVFEEDGALRPLSTGTFQAVNMPDDAAPYSGPLPGPAVPGEDLVANAPDGLSFPTDLSGTAIVISIEPVPDDSPAPFVLKPLVGHVPASAADHQTLPMDNQSETFPTMSITLHADR